MCSGSHAVSSHVSDTLSGTTDPEIIVHHREQLAELLTEAVEVEHNLMCCYLYAAWSLRSGEAGGLTAPQAHHVESWRRTIIHVAIDEMTHFANANNLLAALGVRPHLHRPKLPVSPGYHPACVIVELRQFEAATIDHFVFLERPEGVEFDDGERYARPLHYERATRSDAQTLYLRALAPESSTVDEAIALMKQLSPLNELLTRLPASADEPHARAGTPSAVTREIRVPSPRPSTLVLAERTHELAAGARSLAAIDPQLQRTASELDAMARRIEALPSVDVTAMCKCARRSMAHCWSPATSRSAPRPAEPCPRSLARLVPLQRLEDEAVLRRHPRDDRIQELDLRRPVLGTSWGALTP